MELNAKFSQLPCPAVAKFPLYIPGSGSRSRSAPKWNVYR